MPVVSPLHSRFDKCLRRLLPRWLLIAQHLSMCISIIILTLTTHDITFDTGESALYLRL